MNETNAYFYALGASVCFSTASLLFAHYAKNISSLWMNFFKTVICLFCLLVCMVFFVDWVSIPWSVVGALSLSGLLGLGLGDLFLLSAYARMGAGRTLILFGFQPLILGVSSWYLFSQPLSFYKLTAVFFFLICLFLFSHEKFKEQGHWEIRGLLAALLGVLFDNSGVLLTRWSFNTAPEMGVLQANLVRTIGAFLFYVTLNPYFKTGLIKHFVALRPKQKWIIAVASTAGTFVSLLLYFKAVRVAHLASLSAIGVFGPLYSTTLECLWEKKKPSKDLLLAIASFMIGFWILLRY